jgi:hypothetical protein
MPQKGTQKGTQQRAKAPKPQLNHGTLHSGGFQAKGKRTKKKKKIIKK